LRQAVNLLFAPIKHEQRIPVLRPLVSAETPALTDQQRNASAGRQQDAVQVMPGAVGIVAEFQVHPVSITAVSLVLATPTRRGGAVSAPLD
jgi:hypothetical protein